MRRVAAMTKKRVTAEEIMRAKEVDLLSYLEAKGEQFKKEGKYYRHVDHDSLVIKDNMYAWNSRGEKGYGVINFAQMYYGMSFVDIVKELNESDFKTFERKAPEEKKPFYYPIENEVDSHHKIKNYLIGERKIDDRIVEWLLQKDLIAQDKKNNVVFKWKDSNEKLVGYDLQGTIKMNNKRGSFKYICPTSKENTGFSIDVRTPEWLYFYESPVDMLSHWSIKGREIRHARLISMNGLKERTIYQSYLEAKKEGLDIKGVVLAVDNDEAGRTFIKEVKKRVNNEMLKVDIPELEGDWNDVLKKKDKKKKDKSYVVSSPEYQKIMER